MIAIKEGMINVELSDFSSRTIQKIRIFSSKFSAEITSNVLVIHYKTKEEVYKIYQFFFNLGYMDFDDEIKTLVQNYIDNQRKFQEKTEELISLKSNVNFSTIEYEKFCSDCDNLLSISLRNYQYKSAYLLYTSGSGFDFSVPGAGKTIISYAVYSMMKKNQGINSVFIIGPKNSYNAWYDEYKTCFEKEPSFKNLSFDSIKDAKVYLGTSDAFNEEINFINYEKIKNLEEEISLFIKRHNTLLVVDEAHKVKNPNAQQTKALMEISQNAVKCIELTGTPMPNGYEDLFSECKICFPNKKIIPYSYSELKSMTSNEEVNEIKEKKIMEAIFPYFSRVSKKYLLETGELLPPNQNFIYVQMDDNQQKIYDMIGKLSDDIINDWESEFALSLKKATMIRQLQASSNPRMLQKAIFTSMDDFKNMMIGNADEELSEDELNKLKVKIENADSLIMEQVKSSTFAQTIIKYRTNQLETNKNLETVKICKNLLKNKAQVIIWDVFVDNMNCLNEMISTQLNISCGLINGSVGNLGRQQIIKDFKCGLIKVLIASPATLAESISLHKCCQNAIYVDRNFNAAQFIQSKDRIHRINMPTGTTATYYYLMNENSIDSIVNERLQIKEERMLRILDAEKIQPGSIENSDFSEISTDDVRKAFNK